MLEIRFYVMAVTCECLPWQAPNLSTHTNDDLLVSGCHTNTLLNAHKKQQNIKMSLHDPNESQLPVSVKNIDLK